MLCVPATGGCSGLLGGTHVGTVWNQDELHLAGAHRGRLNASWFDLAQLEGHWTFDAEAPLAPGTPVVDASSYGRDGVFETRGGQHLAIASGKLDQGAVFNGSSDRVRVLDGEAWDVAGKSLSLSLWFRVAPMQPAMAFLERVNGPQGWSFWMHGVGDGPGRLFFEHHNAGAITGLSSRGVYDDNVFHHAVVTLDPTGLARLYVDGALDHLRVLGTPLTNSDEDLLIGNNGGDGSWFNGILDDVTIWSRTLSQEEIRSMYERQRPAMAGEFISAVCDAKAPVAWNSLDVSASEPYGKPFVPGDAGEGDALAEATAVWHLDLPAGSVVDGTPAAELAGGSAAVVRGSGLLSVIGLFNRAIELQSPDAYIELPAPMGPQATLAVWLRVAERGNRVPLVSYQGADGPWELVLCDDVGSCAGYADRIVFTDGSGEVLFASEGALTDKNRWHHIVLARRDQSVSVYFNGELVAAEPYPGPAMPTGVLWLGGNGTVALRGSVDEAVLFDTTLEAAEVRTLYQRGTARIRYQVRACDEPSCDGESFVGPDGADSYFSEAMNLTSGAPSFSLSGLRRSRYLQWRAVIETDEVASESWPRLQHAQVRY